MLVGSLVDAEHARAMGLTQVSISEAERVLKESGISIEKRAKAVDQLAAQILLESYLAAQTNVSLDQE